MADYKEVQGSGKAWKRGHTFVAMNPYEGAKVGIFYEEQVATVGSHTMRTPDTDPAGLQVPFLETGFFPVRDPVSGNPTGQIMTHAELYAILYSLYMDAALKRDAAAEEAALAAENPPEPYVAPEGTSDFT